MLIVCPSCATSYMIDPASIGQGGRKVRCARCKSTWFAGGVKTAHDVSEFVDGVIAEAEADSGKRGDIAATIPARSPAHAPETPDIPATVAAGEAPVAPEHAADDDFGSEEPPPPAEAQSPAPEPQLPQAVPPAVQPVSIADAPSLVPPIEHDHAPLPDTASAAVDSEDIESFAARRERLQVRRKNARRSSRWTAIVLVLLAFNVAMVGARDEVVRYLPQTASLFAAIGLPVNLRHLVFENVKITKETHDGVNVLVVDGNIVSKSGKPAEVPRIRFAARNAAGQELYTWTALPTRSVLAPGDMMEFHSQLASPPAGATDIMVRFFTSKDAAAAAGK